MLTGIDAWSGDYGVRTQIRSNDDEVLGLGGMMTRGLWDEGNVGVI